MKHKAHRRTPRNARSAAATALIGVLAQRRSLSATLPEATAALASPRERALAQELSYGVLRWLPRLSRLCDQLVSKPLRTKDTDVRSLILMGLYQLSRTRIAPHAAVAETVALVEHIGKPWARALVNATLRRYQLEVQELEARVDTNEDAHFAHPEWLITAIRQAWPNHWRQILQANNLQAPMTLRVNRARYDRAQYQKLLSEHGMGHSATPHTTHGITLAHPTSVQQLPEFDSGAVSVQDGAAQLATDLLCLAPGQHVLDACAAPGGKTAHILEQNISARVCAVESDRSRFTRLQESLSRLRLEAELFCADVTHLDDWWNGLPFDRILLDAPCSATGVIRRHPDIKWLRNASDLATLVATQKELLRVLWPLLAPGGLLLYATCSILPGENQLQIERFCNANPDAVERPIVRVWGKPNGVGRQILPGNDDMDGFFYAVLQRR